MVAPHGGGPSAKRIAPEFAFQRGKIKADVKRAAVFGANGLRLRRTDVVSTLRAFQVSDLGPKESLAHGLLVMSLLNRGNSHRQSVCWLRQRSGGVWVLGAGRVVSFVDV